MLLSNKGAKVVSSNESSFENHPEEEGLIKEVQSVSLKKLTFDKVQLPVTGSVLRLVALAKILKEL
jgi:hypothetical protein